MSETVSKYGELLSVFMGCSINGTSPSCIPEDINWNNLYSLAALHNVVPLIYPIVTKHDLPDNVRKAFDSENRLLIARETRQEIEAEQVFAALEAKGIPFIKLKGIVMKHLYPAPYMRTASDVDICLTKEDRENAKPLMESLGYTLKSSIDYHDEYAKDDFYIYELHSDIVSASSPFYKLFSNPFEKAYAENPKSAQLRLTNEYFYLNLILHLYKHFISEGCGLRLFADLYIFRKKHTELDDNFIASTLKEYALSDFHHTVIKLCRCFFESEDYSPRLRVLAEFIFRSGEYGNYELKKLSRISSDKCAKLTFSDKCRYFFSNWFPGVNTMKKRYPVLGKAPFLLPVCWIRRVFYTIFFKRSALKEQRNEIKRLNSKELKEAKYIRTLAGIK